MSRLKFHVGDVVTIRPEKKHKIGNFDKHLGKKMTIRAINSSSSWPYKMKENDSSWSEDVLMRFPELDDKLFEI